MNFNLAEFSAAYGTFKQLPPSKGLEIAFSGHSNVGKSSLINSLFGRRSLARVSATPGKTATVNFYKLGDVSFVDLPGYGYAKVSKSEKERWRDLIGGYLGDDRREIGLIMQLVDFRHPPTKDDLVMIDYLIDCELPFIIVLTKADKLNKSERSAREAALPGELPCFDQLTVVPFSAVSGEGVEQLRKIVEEISSDFAKNRQ